MLRRKGYIPPRFMTKDKARIIAFSRLTAAVLSDGRLKAHPERTL